MTDEEWASAPRVPRISIIRRALRLSQEEFAAHYHIPVGTLRDWEQGRKQPDAAAKAYLDVIASAPDLVRKALAQRPKPLSQPYEDTQHDASREIYGMAEDRAPALTRGRKKRPR